MLVVVLRHCETWRQNGSQTSWSRRRSFVYEKKLIDSASASKGTDAMRRYSKASPRRSVTNKTDCRSHCFPSVCPWLFCEADGKMPKPCSSVSPDFSTPPTLTRNGNPPAAICVPCGTVGGNIANNSPIKRRVLPRHDCLPVIRGNAASSGLWSDNRDYSKFTRIFACAMLPIARVVRYRNNCTAGNFAAFGAQ